MRAGVIICLFATVVLAADAQQKTLREQVREKQAPVRRITAPLVPRMDVAALVGKADVILDARITDARSHLSPDEQWVMTTYALSPVQVLLDRAGRVGQKPALSQDYKVTFLGGEVTIEGFSVSSVDLTLPAPEVGDEVILFLSRSEELQSWVPVDGPYAVFKVKADGRVESPKKTVPHNGEARADFLNRVIAEVTRAAR